MGLFRIRPAYLKANYPIEFMTALLTCEIGHSAVGKDEDSKLVNFINEATEMGIKVLPPDVQKSFSEFSIEEDAASPQPSLPAGEGAQRAGEGKSCILSVCSP